MAVSLTLQSQAFLGALARLRRDGANANLQHITRDVSSNLGITLPGDRGTISSIVRSADKAYRSGSSLDGTNQGPLTVKEHATDATLRGNADRFGYRVVVQVGGSPSHGGFETAITVTSPTTMSFQQIEAAARNAVQQQSLERDYRSQLDRAGPNPQVRVFVLTAGMQ